jgi:hypothetical protein
VQVWDLTPLARPLAWEKHLAAGRTVKTFDGYHLIESPRQLRRKCATIGKVDCYVDFTADHPSLFRAKWRLARSGATRAVCRLGSIPEPSDDAPPRIMTKVERAWRGGPIRFIINVLRRLVAPLIRPGLVIVSGAKETRTAIASGYGQAILQAHNFDYDVCLRHAEATTLATDGFAVFLDQDLCFHPDFVAEMVAAVVTPQRYFPTLCRGLRLMSGRLGVGVRVAAHPRSTYGKAPIDYFEGISIEYGNTVRLIARSAFVVCHSSAAIQFAVLFEKPIVFVTTAELASSAWGKHVEKFASVLGKSVINLDGDLDAIDWHRELRVDRQRYLAYAREYIKAEGSPDVPLWDLVIDHFEQPLVPAVADDARNATAP